MTTRKFTDGQLEAALRKYAGVKAQAAKYLKVDRATVQDRVDNNPRLQQVIRDINEACKDLADGIIMKALKSGDRQMARWFQERKAKDRGYANKIETSLDDAQLEGFVASLGGDTGKLRAALAAFGVSPTEGS